MDFEFKDEFWGKSTPDSECIFKYGIFIAHWFRSSEMSFNKDIFSVEFPQYFTWFNAIEKGNFYIKISVAYIEKYIQSIFTDFFYSVSFKTLL